MADETLDKFRHEQNGSWITAITTDMLLLHFATFALGC